jgi:hypothetical protein
LACSQPPKGRARWTLRLLEEKVVELEIVVSRITLSDGLVIAAFDGLPSSASRLP